MTGWEAPVEGIRCVDCQRLIDRPLIDRPVIDLIDRPVIGLIDRLVDFQRDDRPGKVENPIILDGDEPV